MRLLTLIALILFASLAAATCDNEVSKVTIIRPRFLQYFGVRNASVDGVTLSRPDGRPFNFMSDDLSVVADRRNGPEGVIAIRSGHRGLRFFGSDGKYVMGTTAPRHLSFGQTQFSWGDISSNIYYLSDVLTIFDPQTHALRHVVLRSTNYEHLIFPVVRLKQGFLVVTWQSENSDTLKVSLFSETGEVIALLMSEATRESQFATLTPEHFFDIAPDGTLTFLAGGRSGNRVYLNKVTPDGRLTETLISAPASPLIVFRYY